MISIRDNLILLAILAVLILPREEAFSQRVSDRPVVSFGLFRQANAGTGFSIFLIDSSAPPPVRARGVTRGLLVLAKVGLGGTFGVLLALPVGYVAVGLSGAQGWEALGPGILGAMAGYLVGSTLGVHVISEGQNAETSYMSTLGAGAIGMVIGIGVSTASDGKGTGVLSPLILPIVFEIVYTELIE